MLVSVVTLYNAAGLTSPAPQKEVALMKRIVLLVAMLAMIAFLAAPALAQGPPEIIPPYEQGTDNANSICSFSGINDEPDRPQERPPRVQSYGQLVRQNVIEPSELTSGPGTPGNYCNAHIHPYPENPPPPPGG